MSLKYAGINRYGFDARPQDGRRPPDPPTPTDKRKVNVGYSLKQYIKRKAAQDPLVMQDLRVARSKGWL